MSNITSTIELVDKVCLSVSYIYYNYKIDYKNAFLVKDMSSLAQDFAKERALHDMASQELLLLPTAQSAVGRNIRN